MPTVSTNNTTAFTKTEYPPVFDGSKTVRPRPKRVTVLPAPLTKKETAVAPANNLEFTPPLAGSATLKDLLKEAGEPSDVDTMHVNTFEKLMRKTNHNLLAMQPESLGKESKNDSPKASKVSPRCKAFLAVDHEKSVSLSRADFNKALQADEVLCSLQGLFDFWNKFVLGVESGLTLDTMRRKLKPRFQAC